MVKTDIPAGPEFNLEMPLGNYPEEENPDEGIRSKLRAWSISDFGSESYSGSRSCSGLESDSGFRVNFRIPGVDRAFSS